MDRAKSVILAAMAGLALAEAEAHADEGRDTIQAALATREMIGQAEGILMEREHTTADQAYDILRRASQHLNTKIRDVAQAIVDTGESPRNRLAPAALTVEAGPRAARLGGSATLLPGPDGAEQWSWWLLAGPRHGRGHGSEVYATDGLETPILVGQGGSSEIRRQSDDDAEVVAYARTELPELLGAHDQAGAPGRSGLSAWEYNFVTHSERGGTDSELNPPGAQGWRFVAVVPEKAGPALLLLERSHA